MIRALVHCLRLSACLVGLLVRSPHVASAVEANGLVWSWGEDTVHRWFVSNEVQLPGVMYFMADLNKNARLVAYQTRMVFTCRPKDIRSNRLDITCTIDDISLTGAAMKGDRGLLLPILQETDEKLTGARIDLSLRPNGQIVEVDLEGLPKNNRRIRTMHESLRLLLARSVAAFDLKLPRDGATAEGVWGQSHGLLLDSPSAQGTQGMATVAHLVRSVDEGRVVIETAGKAMIQPAHERLTNYYDTELEGVAVFDTRLGILRERVWSTFGMPTSSSAVAIAGDGTAYAQTGRLLYLPEGTEAPSVGESREVLPPGSVVESAIQPWPALNGPPDGGAR